MTCHADIHDQYGQKTGEVRANPLSGITGGEDYTVHGAYGEKIGGATRNPFSSLTGSDEYTIHDEYGRPVGGVSTRASTAENAGGVLALTGLIVVCTIGIAIAPIFLGRRLAQAWGRPWDWLTLTVMMYLLYLAAGLVLASHTSVKPDLFASDSMKRDWTSTQSMFGSLMFASLAALGVLATLKLAQITARQRSPIAVPLSARAIVPGLLAGSLIVNGLCWLASAFTLDNSAFWSALGANSAVSWFLTMDLGGAVNHIDPGLWYNNAAIWTHLSFIYALADLLLAWLVVTLARRIWFSRPLP